MTILLRAIAFWIDMATMLFGVMTVDIGVLGHTGFSSGHTYTVMLIGMGIMVSRDIFGRSIGKKILGLKIANRKGGGKTKLYQRLLRNITSFIMVVEVIVVLARSDRRRLGDLIAGTEVVGKENAG